MNQSCGYDDEHTCGWSSTSSLSDTVLLRISSIMATITPQMRAFNDVALAMFCGYYDEVIAKNTIAPINGQELLAEVQALIYSQDSKETKHAFTPSLSATNPVETIRSHEETLVTTPDVKPVAASISSTLLKSMPLKFVSTVINDEGKQEEVTKAVDLPYLSCVDYSETCQALKVNGGLLSPCLTRPSKGSPYCKTCSKAGLKYGTVSDRLSTSIMCYQDPKGKKEISFGTYSAKRGIPRDTIQQQISDLYNGLTLPEEQWSVDKTKASRPIKSSSSSSADEPSDTDAPKKKRGRPKKVVKVVEDVTTNDPSEEPDASEGAEVSVAPAQPVAKEESSPKKVSPKKSTKKSKKSSPKKETLVEVSSDEGELVEETPVTEEQEEVLPVEEAKETHHPSDNEDSEDEEDEDFERLTYEGVKYLRDEENTLYLDMEDDVEPVGTWDPVNSTPNFNSGVDIQALLAGE